MFILSGMFISSEMFILSGMPNFVLVFYFFFFVLSIFSILSHFVHIVNFVRLSGRPILSGMANFVDIVNFVHIFQFCPYFLIFSMLSLMSNFVQSPHFPILSIFNLVYFTNFEFLFKVRYDESEVEFEDEVDLLMTSDIVSAQVSTKPITFSKVQSGWFFKEDRQELVGTYNANFYSINGMVLETRKRREHLSNDDLQKNKALLENFAKGKQR